MQTCRKVITRFSLSSKTAAPVVIASQPEAIE